MAKPFGFLPPKQARFTKRRLLTEPNLVVNNSETCTSPGELYARWADAGQRADTIKQPAERGIDSATVAAQASKPEADPFDLLCHLAFNAPVLTRRQRADRLKQQHVAFFNYFAPEAREILDDLLQNTPATANSNSLCPTC